MTRISGVFRQKFAAALCRRFGWVLFFAVPVLAGTSSLSAQPKELPPLVPDRPGFYCGSQALLPGVFHIETGVAFDRLSADQLKIDSLLAPVVLRFGLFDHFELRLAAAAIPKIEETSMGDRSEQSGFSSPAVGLKWQFAEGGESAAQPSMAFLFSLNLPAGSREFRPDRPEPSFNFASDFFLDDQTTLTTNLGVNLPFDSAQEEQFAEVFFAAALGRSFTSRAAWFVEIAGAAPRLDGSEAVAVVDGGLTYLLSNDLQLDVSLTRGLTQAASDWIVAGGISIRLY